MDVIKNSEDVKKMIAESIKPNRQIAIKNSLDRIEGKIDSFIQMKTMSNGRKTTVEALADDYINKANQLVENIEENKKRIHSIIGLGGESTREGSDLIKRLKERNKILLKKQEEMR